MRKNLLKAIIMSAVLTAIELTAQPIPKDSLFLGQKPPGLTPKVFKLEVTPGTFAAERIAISKEGKEIFYSEIKAYYPVQGAKVRCYKYENNRWSGSKVLFDGFMGPGLSITGDTLFVEKDSCAYYSVRSNSGWSSPVQFFKSIKFAHYLQQNGKGSYYVSARSESSVGGSDWSRIIINDKDTTVQSLSFPLNRVVDDLDFYIAKDESYMINCPAGPICISYPGKKGKWTNGRYLNEKINFGLGGWGVYVSPGDKYLFYTTGTKPDYSDVYVYWVGLGNIIDSMKTANLPPYVKNLPKPQNAGAGENFTFILPEDAVCDEDGTGIRYEILSLDSSPLPGWLKFDSKSRTLSGIPTKVEKVVLRVNAYDDKQAVVAFRLIINVSK